MSKNATGSGIHCAVHIWTLETDKMKIICSLQKHTLYDVTQHTLIVIVKNVQKADSIFYNMSLAVGLIRRIPAELKCKKIEISYN